MEGLPVWSTKGHESHRSAAHRRPGRTVETHSLFSRMQGRRRDPTSVSAAEDVYETSALAGAGHALSTDE